MLSLLDEIPDSKGTKYYLEISKSILECFLSKELDIVTQIKEAWFALFLPGTGVNTYSYKKNTLWKEILSY